MYVENGNVLRGGHALFGVFVGENGGTRGVEGGVVVGVVEVPVGVNDEFQWSIAEAVERVFELGPGGRNESVHDELAVRSVEDNDVATGSGEEDEIVSELLRLNGIGAHPRASSCHRVGCRGRSLLGVAQDGRTKKAAGKELSQEGAACKRGGTAQHLAACGLLLK